MSNVAYELVNYDENNGVSTIIVLGESLSLQTALDATLDERHQARQARANEYALSILQQSQGE